MSFALDQQSGLHFATQPRHPGWRNQNKLTYDNSILVQMTRILFSLVSGSITCLYYASEIFTLSKNPLQFLVSYAIQSFHDAVCIYFILVFCLSYHSKTYYIQLNCLYTFIMFLFSIYKRCILTLLYNHTLGLPMCTRYVPIWQRIRILQNPLYQLCQNDLYKSTYLWLNDHIFQSGMMILINLRWLFLENINVISYDPGLYLW